jgi:hypothetical protein
MCRYTKLLWCILLGQPCLLPLSHAEEAKGIEADLAAARGAYKKEASAILAEALKAIDAKDNAERMRASPSTKRLAMIGEERQELVDDGILPYWVNASLKQRLTKARTTLATALKDASIALLKVKEDEKAARISDELQELKESKGLKFGGGPQYHGGFPERKPEAPSAESFKMVLQIKTSNHNNSDTRDEAYFAAHYAQPAEAQRKRGKKPAVRIARVERRLRNPGNNRRFDTVDTYELTFDFPPAALREVELGVVKGGEDAWHVSDMRYYVEVDGKKSHPFAIEVNRWLSTDPNDGEINDPSVQSVTYPVPMITFPKKK